MKKIFRKWFGALLALCMVVSLIPLTAFAESDVPAGLSFTISGDTATITGFTPPSDFNGELIIPSTLLEKSVTTIGKSAFYNCTVLTNISIPDSVTTIDDSAFGKCSSLSNISIPDSVTSIGDFAFNYCTGLTSISIPDSVTSIGYEAFYNCTVLTSINIPNSVTYIDDYAFERCSSLENIMVNDSNINYSSKDGVLFNKDKTILIKYPEGITDTSYTVPNSVITIYDSAFYSSLNLTKIVIPNSVTFIDEYAFAECSNLSDISIPDSVTTIGESVFEDCTGLTSINIPNSVTTIGDYAFCSCTGLTTINMPDRFTTIGESAFDGCTGLTSISIPSSVTTIGESAFCDCTGLINISIPNSVTNIGDYAFENCTGLTIYGVLSSYANTYADDNSITFTELTKPTITTDLPVAKAINSGESATLSVEATGNGTLSYQWYKDGIAIEGANNNSYTATTAGTYKVVVKNTIDNVYFSATSTACSVTDSTSVAPIPTTSYTPDPHDKSATTKNIDDVVKSLEDGDKLTIKTTNDKKSISGDILKEIKGKDVDVIIETANGIQWSFNGKDISDKWDAKDINFNINTEKSEIPSDLLNKFTAGKQLKRLSLDYDGAFGFNMKLTVHIGYLNANQYANIYYYNPETKAFEFKESSKINGAGNADFNFTHASDYVILVNDKAITDTEKDTAVAVTDNTNPKTGERLPIIPISVVAIISVATITFVRKKHKTEIVK